MWGSSGDSLFKAGLGGSISTPVASGRTRGTAQVNIPSTGARQGQPTIGQGYYSATQQAPGSLKGMLSGTVVVGPLMVLVLAEILAIVLMRRAFHRHHGG